MDALVTDVRAEGAASEARITVPIDEATRTTDRITRQYFEPRRASASVDAEIDSPTIRLESLDDVRLSPARVDVTTAELGKAPTRVARKA